MYLKTGSELGILLPGPLHRQMAGVCHRAVLTVFCQVNIHGFPIPALQSPPTPRSPSHHSPTLPHTLAPAQKEASVQRSWGWISFQMYRKDKQHGGLKGGIDGRKSEQEACSQRTLL